MMIQHELPCLGQSCSDSSLPLTSQALRGHERPLRDVVLKRLESCLPNPRLARDMSILLYSDDLVWGFRQNNVKMRQDANWPCDVMALSMGNVITQFS